MNTKISYQYRDACNYKTAGEIVVAGEPSEALIQRLMAAREDGQFFVPEQVGLTHPGWDNMTFAARFPDPEDDHGFVELEADDVTATEQAPTDPRSFEDVVEAFERAAQSGWDPDLAVNPPGANTGVTATALPQGWTVSSVTVVGDLGETPDQYFFAAAPGTDVFAALNAAVAAHWPDIIDSYGPDITFVSAIDTIPADLLAAHGLRHVPAPVTHAGTIDGTVSISGDDGSFAGIDNADALYTQL